MVCVGHRLQCVATYCTSHKFPHWNVQTEVRGHFFFAEGIITACHLTFAGPKGQVSDQNFAWSDMK